MKRRHRKWMCGGLKSILASSPHAKSTTFRNDTKIISLFRYRLSSLDVPVVWSDEQSQTNPLSWQNKQLQSWRQGRLRKSWLDCGVILLLQQIKWPIIRSGKFTNLREETAKWIQHILQDSQNCETNSSWAKWTNGAGRMRPAGHMLPVPVLCCVPTCDCKQLYVCGQRAAQCWVSVSGASMQHSTHAFAMLLHFSFEKSNRKVVLKSWNDNNVVAIYSQVWNLGLLCWTQSSKQGCASNFGVVLR